MIKVTCQECGKNLEAPDEASGGKGKCSSCGTVFDIPLGSDVTNESTPKEESINDMKKCPYCAEDIKKEAVKCRYCGSELEEQKKEQEGIQLKCGKCGHSFVLPKETAGKESTCPNCGMLFDVPGGRKTKDNKVIEINVVGWAVVGVLVLLIGYFWYTSPGPTQRRRQQEVERQQREVERQQERESLDSVDKMIQELAITQINEFNREVGRQIARRIVYTRRGRTFIRWTLVATAEIAPQANEIAHAWCLMLAEAYAGTQTVVFEVSTNATTLAEAEYLPHTGRVRIR